MSCELMYSNLYWNNRNHYTTSKWSPSGCLEDCCHPLTTVGKMQPCEGTNLATVLHHSHSGDQKNSASTSYCQTAALVPAEYSQNTLRPQDRIFSSVYLNLHLPHSYPIQCYHKPWPDRKPLSWGGYDITGEDIFDVKSGLNRGPNLEWWLCGVRVMRGVKIIEHKARALLVGHLYFDPASKIPSACMYCL